MQWKNSTIFVSVCLTLVLNSRGNGQSCYNGYQQSYRPSYVQTYNYNHQEPYYPPYYGAYYQPVAVVGLFPLYTVTNNAVAVAPVQAMPGTQLQAQQTVTQINTATTTTTPVIPPWAMTMKSEHDSAIKSLRDELSGTKQDIKDIKSMIEEATGRRNPPNQAQAQGTQPNPAHTIEPRLGGYKRCIQCHSQSGSLESGSGFAFLTNDGRRLNISEKQEERINSTVKDHSMPPLKDAKGNPLEPLSAEDGQDILSRERKNIPAAK